MQFVLASASPARRRLLQGIGIEPIVCPSHFDEDSIQVTNPSELVKQLAAGKARVIAPQFQQAPPTLVLGCDSVLVISGEVHGKPANPAEAIARWQFMRGRVGELHTGHALLSITDGQITPLVRSQVTVVHFASPSDRQIAAYIATGEPMACAGCFALEGRGGLFVERLEGCHSNVIGLSLPLLRQMVHELGYDITELWSES